MDLALTKHFLYAMNTGSETSMSHPSPDAPHVLVKKEGENAFRLLFESKQGCTDRRAPTGTLTLTAATQMLHALHDLHDVKHPNVYRPS